MYQLNLAKINKIIQKGKRLTFLNLNFLNFDLGARIFSLENIVPL